MRQFLQPTARKIVAPRNASTRSRSAVGARSRVVRFALLAEHAHEPLGDHRLERRRDEIRLDAHVHEPRERAGRVVRVQRGENHVAGERCLHGDLRRFLVANFADEHDVRIVTQNRAQPAREGQPGLFGHLNLVDPLELIFDRVLDRDDLADRVVDLVQRGVERRRLAAAGRAGDEHDAVRHLEHAVEELALARGHAEPARARARPASCRSRRITTASPCSIGMIETRMSTSLAFTRILMRPSCGTRFSAMLRLLRDLDARNDRRLEALDLRGHRHFLQQAVDAVADAQLVLERLDVNVRRAQRNRVAEHLVDEADDRRVLRRLVEIAVVLAIIGDDLEAFLLLEQVQRVGADAEMLFDLALQRLARREDRLRA